MTTSITNPVYSSSLSMSRLIEQQRLLKTVPPLIYVPPSSRTKSNLDSWAVDLSRNYRNDIVRTSRQNLLHPSWNRRVFESYSETFPINTVSHKYEARKIQYGNLSDEFDKSERNNPNVSGLMTFDQNMWHRTHFDNTSTCTDLYKYAASRIKCQNLAGQFGISARNSSNVHGKCLKTLPIDISPHNKHVTKNAKHQNRNAALDSTSPNNSSKVVGALRGQAVRYNCPSCSKGFYYMCHLKVHERVHTREKPFTCDVCGRSFCHSGSLKVHMRIHSGVKPYRCSICSRRFRHSSSFTRHQNQMQCLLNFEDRRPGITQFGNETRK